MSKPPHSLDQALAITANVLEYLRTRSQDIGKRQEYVRARRIVIAAQQELRALPRLPKMGGLLPGVDLAAWGRMLQRQREVSKLSRPQLALLADVSATTIRNVEMGRNRPSRSVVLRLRSVPALSALWSPYVELPTT